MMIRKHPILIFLSLLLACSPAFAGKPAQDRIPQMATGFIQTPGLINHTIRVGNTIRGGNTSGTTAHEEKRHRKTLVSQAIVVDFSLPRRPFTYCTRRYSLFLPADRVTCPLPPSSLRGPPFCC